MKEICEESMKESSEEEVRLTVKGDKEKEERYANNQLAEFEIPLTIGYDMGWNKRSSGRFYNSISGHGIMVGGYSKKIIDYRFISKCCLFCWNYKKEIR